MRSTDFRPVTSPLMTALDRPRHMAKGGHAREHREATEHHGALRHLTIVVPVLNAAPAGAAPVTAAPAPLTPLQQSVVDRWIAYAHSSPAAMRDTVSRIERIRRGEDPHVVAPGLLPPDHPPGHHR